MEFSVNAAIFAAASKNKNMSSLGSFTIPGLVINEPEEVETVAAEVAEVPEAVAGQEAGAAEPEKPDEAQTVAEPVVAPVAPEPQPSFEEVLKQRLGYDLSEVESRLKEAEALKQRTFVDDPELLADDDWLKDFVKTYKRGGDVLKYLEVTKTDYGKMTPEEVIMYDIRANSKPGTPQFLLDRKYQQALAELGHLDDMEPDSQEFKNFRQALEWTATELRNSLAEQGKKFAVPERKPQEPQAPNDLAIEEARKYVDDLMKSAPVMELRANKVVKIGNFSLAVEPDEVVSMVTDNQKLFSHFTNPDGTQNTEKLLKWVALAPNIDRAFESAVSDGIAKARLEWLKELKNPSEPRTEKPAAGSSGISVKWLGR